MTCTTCDGSGVIVQLVETVPGGGPWISNNGKTYVEAMDACPECNT